MSRTNGPMQNQSSIKRIFRAEHFRKGKLLWTVESPNLMPNAALANELAIVYGSTAKAAGLYIGLMGSGEVLAGDTLASHSGWAEITPYSGNRPAYTNGNALSGTYTAWAASTVTALGTVVVPTTANGHQYVCTTSGTTGSTQPTWPTGQGSTVADGTVTWTEDATANASVDNSASKASFTFNASSTIYGAFLCDAASGTTGTLYGAALFSSSRAVLSGDILYVTVVNSLTSQT